MVAQDTQNLIFDGVPASLEEMREYLEEYYNLPVVLRKQGNTTIRCIYCGELHEHDSEPGLHVAPCNEAIRDGLRIFIGERSFSPNYGNFIIEYRENRGVYELISPELEDY